jgi:hypothetical protein
LLRLRCGACKQGHGSEWVAAHPCTPTGASPPVRGVPGLPRGVPRVVPRGVATAGGPWDLPSLAHHPQPCLPCLCAICNQLFVLVNLCSSMSKCTLIQCTLN